MTERLGNRSAHKSKIQESAKEREKRALAEIELLPLLDRSDAGLELSWKRAVDRDQLKTLYSQCKCKRFQFWRDMSCEDFSRMLELLALVTGDALFSDAATRMKKYGFVNGRIKTNSNRMARKCLGMLNAITMPCVHGWMKELERIEEDETKRGIKASERHKATFEKAAMITAVDLNIPGQSFDAVVQNIRKAYSAWLKTDVPW
jgi:hypothetical protein